jgi:hypothetical protein
VALISYLPEDDNHHSHRRGNLKSYTIIYFLVAPKELIPFLIIEILNIYELKL